MTELKPTKSYNKTWYHTRTERLNAKHFPFHWVVALLVWRDQNASLRIGGGKQKWTCRESNYFMRIYLSNSCVFQCTRMVIFHRKNPMYWVHCMHSWCCLGLSPRLAQWVHFQYFLNSMSPTGSPWHSIHIYCCWKLIIRSVVKLHILFSA